VDREMVSAGTERQGWAVRLRVNNSKTQRDGWGYESTAEVAYMGPEIPFDQIEAALVEATARARRVGENERDMRIAKDLGQI
jgi:hypothetical protein